MRGLSKDSGFIIDIYGIDGLETLIKHSEISFNFAQISRGSTSGLEKTIKTLRNPVTRKNKKIKFIVIKITEWALLNACLSYKFDKFIELFNLVKMYPHRIYIYNKLIQKNFSIIEQLKSPIFPKKFHLLDVLANHRKYADILNEHEQTEIHNEQKGFF